jgi:hypothetical protein
MSVIGLSPTDFVGGARVVARGAAALREHGGSKDKYQQTAAGLDARIAASTRAEEFATSAGPSASSAVSVHASNLRRNDLALQNSQISVGGRREVERKRVKESHDGYRSLRWVPLVHCSCVLELETGPLQGRRVESLGAKERVRGKSGLECVGEDW